MAMRANRPDRWLKSGGRGAVLVLLSFAPALAGAEDNPLSRYFPLEPADWDWRLIGGGYEEFKNEQSVYFGGVRAEREASVCRLGWELVGYAVDQHISGSRNSAGIGLNLLLKKVFGEPAGWRPFAEAGAGLAHFNHRTPSGGSNEGTHFNFVYFFGLGLEKRGPEMTWEIGARYFHLSNADKDGADRNPSIDAVGGYLGLSWWF